MSNILHHNHQSPISKWLLVAVLLLSLFTFSGFAIQSRAKPTAQQTSLLVGRATHIVKSIGFNRALRQIYGRYKAKIFFNLPVSMLAIEYTRQINRLLKYHYGLNLPSKQTCFFYRAKTVSSCTGDEPALSLG